MKLAKKILVKIKIIRKLFNLFSYIILCNFMESTNLDFNIHSQANTFCQSVAHQSFIFTSPLT